MKNIRIEIENNVCTIYINREKSFNAINIEVIMELKEFLDKYNNSKEFRYIIKVSSLNSDNKINLFQPIRSL